MKNSKSNFEALKTKMDALQETKQGKLGRCGVWCHTRVELVDYDS